MGCETWTMIVCFTKKSVAWSVREETDLGCCFKYSFHLRLKVNSVFVHNMIGRFRVGIQE